jgi:hypothetical protein
MSEKRQQNLTPDNGIQAQAGIAWYFPRTPQLIPFPSAIFSYYSSGMLAILALQYNLL